MLFRLKKGRKHVYLIYMVMVYFTKELILLLLTEELKVVLGENCSLC